MNFIMIHFILKSWLLFVHFFQNLFRKLIYSIFSYQVSTLHGKIRISNLNSLGLIYNYIYLLNDHSILSFIQRNFQLIPELLIFLFYFNLFQFQNPQFFTILQQFHPNFLHFILILPYQHLHYYCFN